MRNGILVVLATAMLVAGPSWAQVEKGDVFKGKLFPPNVILEHQAELKLSKQQFTAIKKSVVEVQANVAEHEWDVREAYQNIMIELDKAPIDEDTTLEYVHAALLAENQVKKQQMAMLIRLKNLLTDEQLAYLEAIQKE
mgnify:CR=1 FL=1